jgi:hexosaminidase
MKQLLSLIVLAVSISAYCQTNILPTPSIEILTGETLTIPKQTLTLQKEIFDQKELNFLKKYFATKGIKLTESKKNPDITFDYITGTSEEAYKIYVAESILIRYRASSKQGRFYAMVSLLSMIDVTGDQNLVLPKGVIEDAPAFQWRGLHLDVSRHFFTVQEVKDFLEIMALYKFNTFHWHLTDDQGWRIEIKQYPKLTEIGGFRDSTVIGHYTDDPRRYEQTNYGGFYTQEDIKEVVRFAEGLHITVVPEIEMPGHSRAALAGYPELSCTGVQQGVPGLWGVFEDIYCSKEESIVFLQNVLDEVLELFPSEYIHIGGDEAPKARWEKCEDCQKVMTENHLEDTHELQSYFIKRMDAYLTERGRKLIGWDEILEGGLSPNAAVMSWRGEEGGIEAAKQGHYVVMSPTSYCYLDYYQSSHDSEPLAIGGFLPLEKVYKYNPVPKDLTKEEAKYILGGQANLWTEYISTMDHAEYMMFPRALALMQGLWCQNKPNYEDFLQTYLNHHEDFLKDVGVNRAMSIHIPELKIERTENGVGYSWWGMDSTQSFMFECQYDHGALSQGSAANGQLVSIGRGEGDRKMTLYADGISLGYDIKVSDAIGVNIDLVTPPHKSFDTNGSLNLVNGIFGTERWKGDQWLGFNKEKVEMIVELDSIEQLKTLSIGFLDQKGSWIYLPESMVVSISADKENWTLVNSMDIESDVIVSRHSMALNTNGKYIKIEVIPLQKIPEGSGGAGNIPWTFIDEIQIDIE